MICLARTALFPFLRGLPKSTTTCFWFSPVFKTTSPFNFVLNAVWWISTSFAQHHYEMKDTPFIDLFICHVELFQKSGLSSDIRQIRYHPGGLQICSGYANKIRNWNPPIHWRYRQKSGAATNLVDNKVRFTYLDARQSVIWRLPILGVIGYNIQLIFLDNLPGK